MNFFQVVKKRKAIRRFLPDKTIPKEDVQKILETINLAPSARNLQSYKVFVVQGKEKIEKVSQACYSQKENFISNAALILVFCIDPKKAEEDFGERGRQLYTIQDASITATFVMLTATALGYGSCWVGSFKEEEMKELLRTKLKPVATTVIGYPDEDPPRKPRKPLKLLAEFV